MDHIMGIQEKLTDWAEKVVKKYDSVAEKENCTYYTQSNLNKISDDNQVKVLILGINPGSTGGEYEEIEKNNSGYIGNGYGVKYYDKCICGTKGYV